MKTNCHPRTLSCLWLVLVSIATTSTIRPAQDAPWITLFNGRNLDGWDTWLGPRQGGYLDPATTKEPPLGLNHDPLGVFRVVEKDGAPAIRISGELFGAITTRQSFSNVHIRVEYKWGEKKFPPRHEPKHYRDSGILYWCVGPHGAGSYAWMRSVECNIMEKGVGQWWGVAGTYVDIEGKKVVLEQEPSVPYRGESPGETCILYVPGGPQFTTGEGITSSLDPEKPGDWNVCEVIAWGNTGIHILNGQVVLALTNPRFRENGTEFALTQGLIQLQTEGAELFYRKVEARPIDEIPAHLLSHVPPSAPGETNFTALLPRTGTQGWTQAGAGAFQVQDGVASGTGGMGLWWHTNRVYTNFVFRGEFLQESAGADSGVFLRFPNPVNDPWNAVKQGHEMEIGETTPENATWRTGSIYPFKASVIANTRPPGRWNEYEITCLGQNYSVRINGKCVTTWTDSSHRASSGYIGLQNYDDGKIVRHRNLRIKELPAAFVP